MPRSVFFLPGNGLAVRVAAGGRSAHDDQLGMAASRGQHRGGAGVAGGGGASASNARRFGWRAAGLRARHVGVVRGHDRRGLRAAGRHPERRRHDQRADLDHEHRRLLVERGRRRAARDHLPRTNRRAALEDDHDAGADRAPRTERPVLQLVRPPDGRKAHGVAADRRAAHPHPVIGRQRLARHWPADRPTQPARALRAGALFESMDFGFYYRPDVNRIAFYYAPDTGQSPWCYDTVVSESRSASYIGIAKGELPPKEYYGTWRSFPDTCDWSWQETRPVGVSRAYLGVNVFEGAYPYAGMLVTPSWGGSMFEALMPALFVPEERWAPRSWGINHPLTVRAQIYHGLHEAQYGYWGFSPSNTPEGGYAAYGVDAIGMNPGGYPSNEANTLVDRGFAG